MAQAEVERTMKWLRAALPSTQINTPRLGLRSSLSPQDRVGPCPSITRLEVENRFPRPSPNMKEWIHKGPRLNSMQRSTLVRLRGASAFICARRWSELQWHVWALGLRVRIGLGPMSLISLMKLSTLSGSPQARRSPRRRAKAVLVESELLDDRVQQDILRLVRMLPTS